MNEHIQHIAEQYWERVTQGELQEDIVRSLREDGYSRPIKRIRASQVD